MTAQLPEAEIVRQFQSCIHCSQVVVAQYAEAFGYNREKCMHMAAPFAGGCFQGNTCGAVSGAMMVLGMACGFSKPWSLEENHQLRELTAAFQEGFSSRCGSLICRELTGFDFSKPGEYEQALEANVLFQRCPRYVNTALALLAELLEG